MKMLTEPCFLGVSLASDALKTSLWPFYVYFLTPQLSYDCGGPLIELKNFTFLGTTPEHRALSNYTSHFRK